ncbi:MAG: helix-turn-helix domain-containing protein [bacterium]
MNNIIQNLQDLGLSSNEARVYFALIELKKTSAGEIIKKTNLHRSIVYESLDKLVDKKLVTKSNKNNIAFYYPTDPNHIIQRIEVQKSLALDTVPRLKEILSSTSPEINVYEGVESYRKFWLESAQSLPVGSTDFVVGTILGKWREYMGPDLEMYMQKRLERKIIWQTIVFDEAEIDHKLRKQYPDLHRFKIIPKSFSKEGNFNIFGKESVILHSISEPMIIEIKSKSYVNIFKNIFDILWEMGKDI